MVDREGSLQTATIGTHLFLPNAQDTRRTVSGSFSEHGQRNCRPRRRSNARAVLKLSRVQKTRAFRRSGLDRTVSSPKVEARASVVETPSHSQQQLQNSIHIERRRSSSLHELYPSSGKVWACYEETLASGPPRQRTPLQCQFRRHWYRDVELRRRLATKQRRGRESPRQQRESW